LNRELWWISLTLEVLMRTFLLAGIMASTLLIHAQKPAEEKSPITGIHELYLADQGDRGGVPGRKPALPDQMSLNDAERRKRANQLLDSGALKSANDFHDAAFIFQHGDKADDYLLAHVLAMVAVSKGDPRGRWIAAATLDRYLQFIGRPQVFGTQYLSRGYVEYLRKAAAAGSAQKSDHANEGSGKNNPDEWLQEPYNSSLISDSLRAEYCVGPLEGQQKNVIAMNQGKDTTMKPIPGCPK
jgi:hypothetical protein